MSIYILRVIGNKNNDDEEWTFMLHRFEYINYLLGAAYLLDDIHIYLKPKK